MKLNALILLPALAVSTVNASAAPLKPWTGFLDHVSGAFSGDRVWLHGAAVGSTVALVTSGADGSMFEVVRDEPALDGLTEPGVRFGSWAPPILGGPLLLHGLADSDEESLGGAYAVAQSTVIAVGYVTLLKALTGRPDADVDSPLSADAQSRVWRFGFLRGGVYNGWPSGHVSTTTAGIAALIHYYPDATWLKWAGYSMIGYMVAAVTGHARGQMHWFSESVAGALMGYAIGWSVGSGLRRAYESGASPAGTSGPLTGMTPAGPGIRLRFSM